MRAIATEWPFWRWQALNRVCLGSGDERDHEEVDVSEHAGVMAIAPYPSSVSTDATDVVFVVLDTRTGQPLELLRVDPYSWAGREAPRLQ